MPMIGGVPMVIKLKRNQLSPAKPIKRKIKIESDSISKSKCKELSQLIAQVIQ